MAPCPFCDLAAGKDSDLFAYRSSSVFVVPAPRQRPLNRGHMLVLPTVHITSLSEVEPPLLEELYTLAGRVSVAVRSAFGATGATLFQNDDAPDQVLAHLHIHVVPRRPGDDFKLPDPNKDELSRKEREHQASVLRQILSAP
jgi:histidine triad (HIT) family protein